MDRQTKYISNLGRMIQQNTVSSYDFDNIENIRKFQDLLRELFPNFFAKVELEDFNGSLLMKWKGKSSEDPYLFMNHQDTVEPQDGWSHDPFAGDVFDGKLWGRGTLDDKGGLWAMLQAADELIEEGFVPERDIYFEASRNEETTCAGAEEISKALAARGMRFGMVLDEGGMITYEPISGAKGLFAMVGMGERACVDLLFTAKSNGGHASTPEHNTPLVRLGKFMAEADKFSVFTVEIAEPIREMFRRMAPTISGPLGKIYSEPDKFAPLLKTLMPKLSATSRALVQTTIAFTMANGSDGRNVIPSEASVVGNMRVSHHQGISKSIEAITKLAKKYDIETTVLDPGGESPLADHNSKEFKLIEAAVDNVFPGVVTAPYIMTGCSDARHMAPLTDSCFHFLPFTIDKQQMGSIHGIDESVNADTLIPAVDFYKFLMTAGK